MSPLKKNRENPIQDPSILCGVETTHNKATLKNLHIVEGSPFHLLYLSEYTFHVGYKWS